MPDLDPAALLRLEQVRSVFSDLVFIALGMAAGASLILAWLGWRLNRDKQT